MFDPNLIKNDFLYQYGGSICFFVTFLEIVFLRYIKYKNQLPKNLRPPKKKSNFETFLPIKKIKFSIMCYVLLKLIKKYFHVLPSDLISPYGHYI